MASFVDRMVGAALLNTATYEEVEHDRHATGQAAAVVALSAIANGFAGAEGGLAAILLGVTAGLLQWAMWGLITYAVGTGVFRGTATPGEMARTLGFAQTPNLLMAVAGFPLLGGLIRLIVPLWTLVAVIVAIRQALDVSTAKAVLTGILGLAVIIGGLIMLAMVAGLGLVTLGVLVG